MAIVGFWWCSLNSWSLSHWAVSRPGSIWLGDTLSHTYSDAFCILLFHDVFVGPLWATCSAQSIDSWLSLRLVINRTALNPEWIRGRLLVQRDELWSNRRRIWRRIPWNSSGLPLHEFACQCLHFGYVWMGQNPVPLVNLKIAGKWMFIPLNICLYDLVCKFFLCFHDCSLLSIAFLAISCTALRLKLFNSSWARCYVQLCNPEHGETKTLDRSQVGRGRPQKDPKGCSVQFQPSVISAQREGLRCWLWQCFSCSFAVLWDLMALERYDQTTPKSWRLKDPT